MEQKPREFWIYFYRDYMEEKAEVLSMRSPPPNVDSTEIHVIEKSAYDDLQGEYYKVESQAFCFRSERDKWKEQALKLESKLNEIKRVNGLMGLGTAIVIAEEALESFNLFKKEMA